MRFLIRQSSPTSTYDTNHIESHKQTYVVLFIYYMILFNAQVGELFIVCKGTIHRNMMIGFS